MAKVYISSTFEDLKEYRAEVLKTLRRMQQEVIAMEDYAAADERPLAKCLADVEKCDYYLGIFAKRYGFIAPNDNGENPEGKSITELEYRHAVRTAKKCFIFLVHAKAKWTLEHVDGGAGGEKLRNLCEELKLKHSVAFFENEDELAVRVSEAFLALVLPAPAPTMRKLPPFAHAMCNRARQTRHFKEFFDANLKTRPGVPQICFVQGEKGECHDSLVKRLSVTEIKGAADDPTGPFHGVMDAVRVVNWVEASSDLEELKKDLQFELFRQFADRYKGNDYTATSLSKLAAETQKRLIVIKHTVYAADCTDLSWDLIKWCLSFWASMEIDQSRPQFIIFFNVVYPRSEPINPLKFWRAFTKFNKEQVKEKLKDISTRNSAGLPCLLLEELPAVQQKHVEEWFAEYQDKGDISLETRHKILSGLFPSENALTRMEEVEIALERLVRAYG